MLKYYYYVIESYETESPYYGKWVTLEKEYTQKNGIEIYNKYKNNPSYKNTELRLVQVNGKSEKIIRHKPIKG